MSSRGVNKVILIGRLGKDPESGTTAGGEPWCNFSVATSEVWKDKETQEKKETTEWHRVSIFGKLAKIAADYLKKGSQVYLEGSNKTRKWQDKSGNDRYTTEVVCYQMQMLGGRQEGSQQGAGQAQGGEPQRSQQQRSQSTGTPHGRDGGDFDDGDIPF